MLAIKAFRVNQYSLFGLFSGKETLRKRRPFVGERSIGRYDRKLTRLQPSLNKFFRSIAGDHSSAENQVFRGLHAFPRPKENEKELLRSGPRKAISSFARVDQFLNLPVRQTNGSNFVTRIAGDIRYLVIRRNQDFLRRAWDVDSVNDLERAEIDDS